MIPIPAWCVRFICFGWMIGWLLVEGLHAAEPAKLAWATPDKPEWDGWVKDVVKLRAERKTQPMEGNLYSETVTWDSYHDVNQGHLADGRVLSLEWKDKEWEVLSGWNQGKKLILCYDEASGATLLDSDTKKRFPVSGVWKKAGGFVHPVDAYLDSLDAYTTYDMMSACYEARRLWRLEIDRVVKKVLAKKHLPKKTREEFIALSAARVKYCVLQGSFGASAIHADITGTARGPMGLNYVADVYRDAFRQLAALADHLPAYDSEPEK